jgi:hypothetical protein
MAGKRRHSPRQGRAQGDAHDAVKGHKVAATPDDPQILVETEDGARAAHKPEALHKD